MKQSLLVGSGLSAVEFGKYIKEEGISVEPQLRNAKEIIALSGKLYRKGKKKYNLNVELLDMYDDYYRTLMNNLPSEPDTPVYISFTDLMTNQTITGNFYVTDNTYRAKKVVGTLQGTPITEVTGATFRLEQV